MSSSPANVRAPISGETTAGLSGGDVTATWAGLVSISPATASTAAAILHRPDHVPAVVATRIRITGSQGQGVFCRHDELIAQPVAQFANRSLKAAVAEKVDGVDEIPAALHRVIEYLAGLGIVAAPAGGYMPKVMMPSESGEARSPERPSRR